MTKKNIYFLLLFFTTSSLIAQTANIRGIVKNSQREPINGVNITYGNSKGTITNEKGEYSLVIPAKKEIVLIYSHVEYNKLYKRVKVPKKRTFRYSPTMSYKTEEINEVTIQDKSKIVQGIISIKKSTLKRLPGANSGVENLLMTLAGVSNNNELSTQYNVRGGNFDENLVYVNNIEIYRPFLVRSGQQEGLSFVNSEMIENINFSAGGFQAKYGDKLSSVLDITYREPKEMKTNINLNLMGGSATFENLFLKDKLSTITSIRYRNNELFVNSKDTETNYKPLFVDIQSFLSYKISDKLSVDFLGNISINNYNYTPLTRKTKFGTASNPIELTVFYKGNEHDAFHTFFGAFNTVYKHSNHLKLSLTTAAYNTQEEEFFDIIGAYSLNKTNEDGAVEFNKGVGGQISHSRNELDALIKNIQLRISSREDDTSYELGMKIQRENIIEKINEWEVIDSTGFALRPLHHNIPNNQPYAPYTGPIEPYNHINANNDVSINRFSSFLQWSKRTNWKEHDIWYNFGIRSQFWNVNSERFTSTTQKTVSPRGQFAIKPDWDKDMVFRISGGLYHQPPSYKELKDYSGEITKDVKAQKSFHLVIGNDYSFQMWNRPFKFTAEAYSKKLSNVNTYTVDNVRIRYRADNSATATAVGLDLRLNGEFVPGNESWVSMGILSTKENIDGQGSIPRPTDQRFKLGVLFQDYVPTIPDLKVYLNLVYNSGLPGGSPSYNDPYAYQSRLPGYKRADVGFAYVIINSAKKHKKGLLSHFKELNAGFEIFNVFDIKNTNTNTWVRDVYSKQIYGVPNYMTSRVISFDLEMRF